MGSHHVQVFKNSQSLNCRQPAPIHPIHPIGPQARRLADSVKSKYKLLPPHPSAMLCLNDGLIREGFDVIMNVQKFYRG
jgi:hypothetical protein